MNAAYDGPRELEAEDLPPVGERLHLDTSAGVEFSRFDADLIVGHACERFADDLSPLTGEHELTWVSVLDPDVQLRFTNHEIAPDRATELDEGTYFVFFANPSRMRLLIGTQLPYSVSADPGVAAWFVELGTDYYFVPSASTDPGPLLWAEVVSPSNNLHRVVERIQAALRDGRFQS